MTLAETICRIAQAGCWLLGIMAVMAFVAAVREWRGSGEK